MTLLFCVSFPLLFYVTAGLINLVAQYYLKFLFGSDVNVLNWEVCGRSIVFMCCESLGYFVVVLLAENLWLVNLLRAFQKQREQSTIQQLVKPNQEIDEDVNDEFLKAKTANPRENCLLIQDLKKVYRPTLPGGVSKFAVRGLSLACPMGERFGLLGIFCQFCVLYHCMLYFLCNVFCFCISLEGINGAGKVRDFIHYYLDSCSHQGLCV